MISSNLTFPVQSPTSPHYLPTYSMTSHTHTPHSGLPLSMLISLHFPSLHSHFLPFPGLFCAPAGLTHMDCIQPTWVPCLLPSRWIQLKKGTCRSLAGEEREWLGFVFPLPPLPSCLGPTVPAGLLSPLTSAVGCPPPLPTDSAASGRSRNSWSGFLCLLLWAPSSNSILLLLISGCLSMLYWFY